MNIYLLLLVLISLIGIKIHIKESNSEYLSIDKTNCVKGIFVLVVFFSHLVTYFKPEHYTDSLMLNFRDFLGQLMVVPFLFYSGYGIYESIKKKKEKYINSIPRKRVLKTWLNFALVILLFLILSIVLNDNYGIKKIALSFVAWDTIGNSNWYIFSIIIMYLLTYISFKIFDSNNKNALILNIILSVIYVLVMNTLKEEYWFNTVLSYTFGLIYSYNKDNINKILFNNFKYLLILPIVIITFISFRYYFDNYWAFEIYSILFICLIMVISVKVELNSPILKWFGENVFYIYILQRIPMIVFARTELIDHIYRYTAVTFVCTIILTIIVRVISNKLFKKI